MELVLEQTQQGTSYEVSVSAEGVEELKIKVKIKGEKKEALLTLRQKSEYAEFDESNANVLERFYTSAGNPVKEILLKLNLPDHRILKDGHGVKEFQRSFRYFDIEHLSRSDAVLKLKNLKKDATLKLFKITYQERYEHVGPEVTSLQDSKVYKMVKRDYAWLMISRDSLAYLKLSLGSSIYRVWKLVDTPYRAMWDTTYWGFLGVRTTFDIFQNILLIYCEYGVLVSLRYGVLGLQSFTVICEV
ncbi:hypothetical protein Tco_0324601 [Tanacetum coccineum]